MGRKNNDKPSPYQHDERDEQGDDEKHHHHHSSDTDSSDTESDHSESEKEAKREKRRRRCKKVLGWMKNNKVLLLFGLMLLILIGLGVGAYYIISEVLSYALLLTDCSIYANSTTVPQKCPNGREFWASLCHLPCPPGFYHTASCTCTKGAIVTDCEKYGVSTGPPMICKPFNGKASESYAGGCYGACDPGTQRSAACTCVSGTTITNCTRFGAVGIPRDCGSRELYGTSCLTPCPSGYTRADICACYRGSVVTDCGKYGSSDLPNVCPSYKEYYGLGCFNKCPSGYSRTAACTCQRGSTTINCINYGIRSPLRCPPGKVYAGGLCYDPCPNGGTRTAVCTCQWDGLIKPSPKLGDCLPGTYDIASLCYTQNGPLTSCYHFGSSVSLPSVCNPDEELYASACYAKCPSGQPRSSACGCGKVDVITNCFLYGNATYTGPEGPKCAAGSEYFGGICYKSPCPSGQPRTASCTCDNLQRLQDCSLYSNAASVGFPGGPACGPNEEYYAGLCYSKCPPDLPRTAACTCDSFKIVTDCSRYGNGIIPGFPGGPECKEGEDLHGGVCYKAACPSHQNRTAACTCDDYKTETNCKDFGDGRSLLDPERLGPQCEDDEDYMLGLCYRTKCPEGYTRSAACTCQRNEEPDTTAILKIMYEYVFGGGSQTITSLVL